MSKYLVVNWELQSVWAVNNLSEIDENGSRRYEDVSDMIKGIQSVLANEERALKERHEKEQVSCVDI